ncbi:MAG: ATP-binding protein [Paludibacteraceae bacterium]|nr:ATP-binding protein [Paludibacteraceae bacterium]
MSDFQYKKRIADEIIEKKLNSSGAVLVVGPKWCGKTTTSEQHSCSVNYISDPMNLNKNMILAEININSLLEGDKPKLLDEWQIIPQLWDAVRFAVDHSKGVGQFILTGSAVPMDNEEQKKIHHTGTGRITTLRMRPMSLWESGDSNGKISLQYLFDNPDSMILAESSSSIEDIAFLICRGGWPIATTLGKEYALETAFSYYKAVADVDISRVDGVKRSSTRAKRLMRSLARHQGSQVTLTGIKNDMASNDTESLDVETVSSYIEALKKIYVIEDMEAWNPNLRSKAAIRTTDTRYYVDPSIATAALGIGPADLVNDLNTMGLLFETMAVRDLRTYAESIDGDVFHYRDSNGLECDSVIHLRNGRYGLVEIKLGGQALIEEGAKTLNKFESLIDTKKMNGPSFKMILTAVGSLAYKREDGIYVVPIDCLKN